MSAQLTYNYFQQIGSAGGIIDLSPYAIDTFINEEETGDMRFGIGVVQGSIPGANILKPTADSTVTVFEGITTNNRTTQHDLEGDIYVRKGKSVGVMRYGKIYGRVATDVEPAYGDKVYVLTEGDEAGFLTNEESGLAIKARFLGPCDPNAQVAPVELFNQAQE